MKLIPVYLSEKSYTLLSELIEAEFHVTLEEKELLALTHENYTCPDYLNSVHRSNALQLLHLRFPIIIPDVANALCPTPTATALAKG